MRVYLDHNATSPLRPAARRALDEALALSANPSSVHREGQRARAIVETAREGFAAGIGAAPGEVMFTSGGTEACNLAIAGVVSGLGVRRIVVSAIEHPAVREPARAAGVTLDVAPVTRSGLVDLEALSHILSTGDGVPTLVCVMAANNETGAIQPVGDVVAMAHAQGALVLCDAAQALGKMPFDVSRLGVDLAAFAGHKTGAPLGVGALYIRSGLALPPLMHGGGQERGQRGGTESVALIASLAAAFDEATASLANETARLAGLRDRLEEQIRDATPDACVIAGEAPRLANTAAIALPGARAETLVIALDLEGFAVSAGSACSSGKVGASHVMAAMGLEPGIGMAAIRVSLGWNTGAADVDAFARAWASAAPRIERRAAA
jgi:cysteine desulfurase